MGDRVADARAVSLVARWKRRVFLFAGEFLAGWYKY
jgi:hypothetical protein